MKSHSDKYNEQLEGSDHFGPDNFKNESVDQGE